MNSIVERIALVHDRMAAAARRAGRAPDEITLVAVTKTHPVDVIAEAIAAGVHDLGENRVQEAEQKIPQFPGGQTGLTWHLIGHLQRNKAKTATHLFDIVHSLDSLRLAETLNRHVETLDATTIPSTPQPSTANVQPLVRRRLPVLLQVNVSGEASKEGFDLPGGPENHTHLALFLADVERMLALPHLHVQGLMTIAPLVSEPEQARPVFRTLRRLRDLLARRFPATDWPHLSMGMTDDFEVAIEEGATIIRVGRAIFGARPAQTR